MCKTIDQKISILRERKSFLENVSGSKVFGFTIKPTKERGNIRYYARKKIEGKQYNLYISSKIETIEQLENMVKENIEKKNLPLSLLDLGIE